MTQSKSLNKKEVIKNRIALFLTLLSFCLFVPGITLPMLKLHSAGTIQTPLTSDLSLQFFKSANSILNTVHNLFKGNNKFVACMIFLFSVIVPIVKAILFSYVLVSKKAFRKKYNHYIPFLTHLTARRTIKCNTA